MTALCLVELLVRKELLQKTAISFDLLQEVEPRLKYERVGNDVTTILSKDAASCLAVHPKVGRSS